MLAYPHAPGRVSVAQQLLFEYELQRLRVGIIASWFLSDFEAFRCTYLDVLKKRSVDAEPQTRGHRRRYRAHTTTSGGGRNERVMWHQLVATSSP